MRLIGCLIYLLMILGYRFSYGAELNSLPQVQPPAIQSELAQ